MNDNSMKIWINTKDKAHGNYLDDKKKELTELEQRTNNKLVLEPPVINFLSISMTHKVLEV